MQPLDDRRKAPGSKWMVSRRAMIGRAASDHQGSQINENDEHAAFRYVDDKLWMQGINTSGIPVIAAATDAVCVHKVGDRNTVVSPSGKAASFVTAFKDANDQE